MGEPCVPYSPPALSLRRGSSREDRGGYDCQLVHPPPSHLQTECAVCLQILKEPCILSCCGHKFCRECIDPVARAGKSCPLCNAAQFSFMREQSLDRALLDFDVFCSAREEGCEWTGKLRDFELHLNRSYSLEDQLSGCQFVLVECVHPHCGLFLQRRHIAVHQSEQCRKRPYSCHYCRGFSSTFEEVTDSHYTVCGQYPVACPNGCSCSLIVRDSLQQHLKEECPLTVVQCPFLYAGCLVSVPRQEMSAHTQDIAAHFVLLGNFTMRLARENRELHFHIAKAEEEAAKNERDMRERISKLAHTCCISNHHIGHREMMERRGASRLGAIPRQVLSKKMEMDLRSMYFAVLPYEFRMESFLSFKRGPFEYSPVFYTHPFGYKFRVKVLRTEYSKVLSLEAFTSVYVEILPGPFDERLSWPFRGSVTIAILNQLSNFNHFERTIDFSDKAYQRAWPESGSTVTCGCKPFIYHKELRNELYSHDGRKTQYLKGGALVFRITKID